MNLEQKIQKELQERLDALEENEYDDWLDEIDGTVKIGNLEYATSVVLKNTDPTAYRCGFSDYQDSMSETIEEDIRQELEDSDLPFGCPECIPQTTNYLEGL